MQLSLMLDVFFLERSASGSYSIRHEKMTVKQVIGWLMLSLRSFAYIEKVNIHATHEAPVGGVTDLPTFSVSIP